MIYTICAILSVGLTFLSGVSYIRATLEGRVQPNLATWLLWAIAPLIGTVAQLASGVGLSTIVVFSSGFFPLCVVLASFRNPQSYWKLQSFDYACGVFSLLALVLWAVTRDAAIAILLSILSDMLAAIPTLRKCYTHPETEDRRAYVLATLGNTVGLGSIREYSFESLAFNLYLAAMPALLVLLLYRKRQRQV